jgi:hypothetical protein
LQVPSLLGTSDRRNRSVPSKLGTYGYAASTADVRTQSRPSALAR